MPTLPLKRELTCTYHYFSISNIARVQTSLVACLAPDILMLAGIEFTR